MKIYSVILVILIISSMMFGFSILDNTKVSLILKPQVITVSASSTAISMKGYERLHVLVALTIDPAGTTTDTLVGKIYEAPTVNATYTTTQTSTFTGAMNGFLEFEVIKDLDNPFVKIELTPSATMTITVLGVYYGSANAPF